MVVSDVIIIGAGVTGVMTARLLSKYDCSVTVLERGSDVAWGASRANSSISHAGYDAKEGTLKAQLNVRGTELMEGLCRELGAHYKRTGSHVIAFGDEDLAHIRMLYERGLKNGVPGLRLISGDELRKMEPNVSENAVGSLYAPTAGIISTYGLTIAAAENAATNGVRFVFDFCVTDVSYENDLYTVRDGDGRAYAAKYLINAAGAAAPEIASIIGEKNFPVVSTPRRGDYIILDREYGKLANSTLFVTPSKLGKGILVSPTVDGNTIIGPNARDVGDPFDKATTADGLAEIINGAHRIMPTLNVRGAIKSFAGVRPTTNMSDFYIRPSEQLPRVIHAASIESPGLAASPAIGEYIVKLLSELGFAPTEKADWISTRRKDGNPKLFSEMTDEERLEAVKRDPAYGRIICRCETVTEGDLLDAIHSPIPATNLDMLKNRTRAGMGRCQGGFCSPRAVALLAREAGVGMDQITKFGGGSWILYDRRSTEEQ